jgi:GAF domain-containing protein/nitrogen-specific signal transduction histidine kinase
MGMMDSPAIAARLLGALAAGPSPEEGLARSLEVLLRLTGARAAGAAFRLRGGRPGPVTASAPRSPALEAWLREALWRRGSRRAAPPPGWSGSGRPVVSRFPLGPRAAPVGELWLVARPGGLRRSALPREVLAELGLAVARLWQLHDRTLRLSVAEEVTGLLASPRTLEEIYQGFAAAAARLVEFDALAIGLIDAERRGFRVVDVTGRSVPLKRPETWVPLPGTLVEAVLAGRAPLRVDDLSRPSVPALSRERLLGRGYRAAVVVPLFSGEEVIGTLHLCHRRPRAFTAEQVEGLARLARPLAVAIEHRRLLSETHQRAWELGALYATSQLITSRLTLPAVLEAINRTVTELTGATGCGIGLVDEERQRVHHVAAHGFRTEEWRSLALPLGEGIIGRVAATGLPIRSDDVREDPRSARRDVDEREGIRSMLVVPLRDGEEVIGVVSAFSTEPGAFTAHHQTVLEAFAEQAGIAVQNARFLEERLRWARQMQALNEAGRAVNRSLDPNETIRVILEQAREVLGAASCGLMALDPEKGELYAVGSLDLAPEILERVRLRVGEGIAGLAVLLKRPVQSADLWNDARVRYRELPRESGFRSMLAVPLLAGDSAIGALTVFRKDVHHFPQPEESLLSAFADQAAMALEHARLFASVRQYSEQLEGMVEERTRALDQQKRFVEVVLDTLPLGLFVLDRDLSVVTANPAGTRALPSRAGVDRSFLSLVPEGSRARVAAFLRDVLATQEVRQAEEEMTWGGEAKTFRLTAAPLASAAEGVGYAVLVVEDITLGKRLAQQMLLTERLTVAGRLAAGVAHELNNPLATIAGCAEALRERARDPALSALPAFQDFASYLRLIEEEAYRCKEITGSLLQFVRDPGSRRQPTDLHLVVDKALDLLRHQARFAGARFVVEPEAGLPPALANEGQLRQVFLGLAANALEAMEGRGRLTVRSRRLPGGELAVEFEDEGPGMPDDVLPRIFDPFFTTKPPGQGTGLGLAIAQSIVADHGGRIEVQTRVGRGSVFRVVLPERPGGERA